MSVQTRATLSVSKLMSCNVGGDQAGKVGGGGGTLRAAVHPMAMPIKN